MAVGKRNQLALSARRCLSDNMETTALHDIASFCHVGLCRPAAFPAVLLSLFVVCCHAVVVRHAVLPSVVHRLIMC